MALLVQKKNIYIVQQSNAKDKLKNNAKDKKTMQKKRGNNNSRIDTQIINRGAKKKQHIKKTRRTPYSKKTMRGIYLNSPALTTDAKDKAKKY